MARNDIKAQQYINVVKDNWVFLVGMLVLLFNYKTITGFFKGLKTDAANEAYVDNTVTVKTGNTTKKVSLGDIANGIYSCFYNYGFGVMEDEAGAMAYIRQIPRGYGQTVATLYRDIEGKNKVMYQDIQKFLNAKEYASIKNFLI